MDNMTLAEYQDYLRQNPVGVCGAGVAFLRGHADIAAAWNACTRPGWMATFASKVLRRHSTPEEQATIASAISSVGIDLRDQTEDAAKADAFRAALPGLFA